MKKILVSMVLGLSWITMAQAFAEGPLLADSVGRTYLAKKRIRIELVIRALKARESFRPKLTESIARLATQEDEMRDYAFALNPEVVTNAEKEAIWTLRVAGQVVRENLDALIPDGEWRILAGITQMHRSMFLAKVRDHRTLAFREHLRFRELGAQVMAMYESQDFSPVGSEEMALDLLVATGNQIDQTELDLSKWNRIAEIVGLEVNREREAEILRVTEELYEKNLSLSGPALMTARTQFTSSRPDQGLAGTCTVFAATAALEAAYAREYGRAVDFSEMWLLHLSYKRQLRYRARQGPTGVAAPLAQFISPELILGWMREEGMCEEDDLPYQHPGNIVHLKEAGLRVAEQAAVLTAMFQYSDSEGNDVSAERMAACTSKASSVKNAFANFKYVCWSNPTMADVGKALKRGIPLYTEFYRFQAVPDARTSSERHAVLFVGLDFTDGTATFRNSWGAGIQKLPQSAVWGTVRGASVPQNLEKACAYLGPKDQMRICADPMRYPGDMVTAVCSY